MSRTYLRKSADQLPLASRPHDMEYLVYAVQACSSSVLSISARGIPNPSQYVRCRLVSLSMCPTMAAAWSLGQQTSQDPAHGKGSTDSGNLLHSFGLVAGQGVRSSKVYLNVNLASCIMIINPGLVVGVTHQV